MAAHNGLTGVSSLALTEDTGQVRVAGAGPALAPVGEVVGDRGGGERVDGAIGVGEVQPPVGQVDVGEQKMADLSGHRACTPIRATSNVVRDCARRLARSAGVRAG